MNNEPTAAEVVEWQEREHPKCDECDGHVNLDCTCQRNEAGDRIEAAS